MVGMLAAAKAGHDKDTLYIIIEEMLRFNNKIFNIDNKNIYHHASAYNWYIATFILSMFYLCWNALKFSIKYQNDKNFELCGIIVFVVFGMLVQAINQDVKIFWITIAISEIFIYIYYNGIIQNIDGMTKLLNQYCYKRTLKRADKMCFALVIFDVNDFKEINDQFGHNMGDRILKNIAKIIKQHYRLYGKCYRIGGDEFAVIMNKGIENVEVICNDFAKKVHHKRQKIKNLPYVSYGYSIYDPTKRLKHSVKDTVTEADEMMYCYKKKAKRKCKINI